MLFFIVAAILLLVVAATRQLMQSRYGELLVAVRDQEERVRFLGYDPADIKVVAYTVAAFFAGIAGAMFVPIVGIISPSDVGIVPSIAFLIGVAIGGRTTLLGPVLGAIGVAWARPPCRRASPPPGPTRRHCCSSSSSGSSPPESPGSPSSVDVARKQIPPTIPRPLPPNPNWSRPDERTRIRRQCRYVCRVPRNPGSASPIRWIHRRRRVDLTLFQGDLRFLIGPNGAGKTTLVDAVTGLVPATGSVTKSGIELLGKKTHKIARLGVGRTFQTASVFEELSVLQNLDIAAGAGRSPWQLLRRRKDVLPEIEQALETIGLTAHRDTPAGILAHGQKQWLEIGMLLVQNADVLLLDEPVAGMSGDEREETGQLLRRIGAQRTVVVVEHDMDFMRAFATSVTVLARGKVIADGTVEEVQNNPQVQQVYLGTTAAVQEA